MTKICDGELDIASLLKVQAFFNRVFKTAKSELEKAGAIHTFSCAYELAWKTMKRILNLRGIDVNSPREAFRRAGIGGLIADAEPWFEILKKRNLTTHVYDEEIALEVFESLPEFSQLLDQFINTIQKL